MEIEVRTQAELDAAIAGGETSFRFSVAGEFNIRCPQWISVNVSAAMSALVKLFAWGSSHVEAWGSSHVVARGSSHVEAWGSSHVVARESSHVVARGSSHVVARESSHVEAKGFVSMNLFGLAKASLGATCHAFIHGTKVHAEGGQQTSVLRHTPQQWCDYWGVKVVDGIATLFKALDNDFKSPRGMLYVPGTIPSAPDWDGGDAECGGGLHFSPTPAMAMEFAPEAKRFTGCPVALTDISVHPDGDFPQKIKARRCCGPVWECDRDGKPVKTETEKEQAAT
jgi:hypothetical protein